MQAMTGCAGPEAGARHLKAAGPFVLAGDGRDQGGMKAR